jgi:hypothetical membrane protein
MKRIAIWCGVLGVALLAAGVLIAAAVTPGYDHLRQFMSELGATGAPTGPWISLGVFVPSSLLLLVFWLYCARRLSPGPVAAIGFIFMALFATAMVGGGVFPCESGCPVDDSSPSQVMHSLFGALAYLAGVIGLFVSAIGMRRAPGGPAMMALGLVCAVAAAVLITGIHPEFEFHGAFQRGAEGAIAIWTLACAWTLSRQAANRPPRAA